MPELRWALIGLGLLFLAGLAVWEWRKSKRRHFTHAYVEPAVVIEPTDRARRLEPGVGRLEPSIDGISAVDADPAMSFDVPTIHPVEPVRVALSAGSAVDIPAAARFELSDDQPAPAAVAIQWPPAESSRVLSLRVVNARGEPLPGRALRAALDAAGLRHGPQKIYHLATPEGAVLVSVANLMQPGSFDPAVMDAQQFRGLNVFSVLPGLLPPQQMLDELVGVARALAHRLGAVVQDSDRQDLDGERLAQLQQSLADEAP
jgi:cell division protein ZipA